MTVYFAGNSLASFTRSLSDITELTSATVRDTAFVDTCIYIPASSGVINSPVFGPATGTVWLRFDVYVSSSTTTGGVTLRNGENNVFRLMPALGGLWTPQYWNGSAWVATGSSYTWPNTTLLTVVIRVDLGVGFEMFVGGISVSSGTGWTGGATQADNLRMSALGANTYFSQIVVADYDLRDTKFKSLALTGNSASNAGQASGTFSDVQELGLNDATAINIATAGNKAGQTKAALTVPSGYQIVALAQGARLRATSPSTNAKLGVRSGGNNYSSAGLGVGSIYAPANRIDHTDPATAAAWTESGVNSAEIYQEAV